jgi:hypothetical protein
MKDREIKTKRMNTQEETRPKYAEEKYKFP